MSNYQFSLAERWAVFQTHGTPQGTTCWLCYEPLNFLDMQVDHILPEWLGNDDRTALFAGVKTDFGLPSSFDLNDYGNWLPSHPRCNNKKSQTVFRSTPIILVWLQQASERADKARSAEGEEKTKRRTDNAIGVLVTANSEVRAKALHELGVGYAEANSAPVASSSLFVPPSSVQLSPTVYITYDTSPLADLSAVKFEVKSTETDGK